jgi:hypothetical protein
MSDEQCCHYLRGLIAVPAGAFDGQPDEARGEGEQPNLRQDDVGNELTPLGPEELNDLIGGGIPVEVLGTITENISQVFAVDDPISVSTALRENGIEASPIHALGPMSHFTKMTGTPPRGEYTPARQPNITPASSGRIIAVVDSGVTTTLPDWMSDGSVRFDANLDVEDLGSVTSIHPNPASHGVFVAGLLRRLAPEHTIEMARVIPRPIDSLSDPQQCGDHEEGDDPTTELDAAAAIVRLVDRIGADCGSEVAALNLSLGGVSCGEGDPLMVLIRQAVDYWRNHFPRAPIFAAGGNRADPRPVFPGALNHVRAVAASRDSGQQVVWNAKTHDRKDASPRSWITDVAPGSDLTGPSGRSPDEWIEWSGSSFATAFAAGCYASRRNGDAADGLTYWPDRATDPSTLLS